MYVIGSNSEIFQKLSIFFLKLKNIYVTKKNLKNKLLF